MCHDVRVAEPVADGGDTEAHLAPSARNFVSEMDLASLLVNRERCVVRAPVTDAVRSARGTVSAGAVMTLVDLGTSSPALVACRPDWTATLDLTLHGARPITVGPIVVDARLVRVGKNVVVVSADIYDGRGNEDIETYPAAVARTRHSEGEGNMTLAGQAITTFARLPRSAASGVDDYDPAGWVGQIRHMRAEHPVRGQLYEQMGLDVVDERRGVLTLARTPYVVNSINTINGGAQAILAEAAAEAVSPGHVATDMDIRYLSQLKVGPARTACRVLRRSDARSVVSVELQDAGNSDRILALATVTLEAVA